MKKTITHLLFLVSIVSVYRTAAQNPLWTLPGNYWKSLGNQLSAIPNYSTNFVGGSIPLEHSFDNYPDFAHAAMPDAQGNPLFSVIDGAVLDKNGNVIDQLRYHRKGSEVNLSLPNSCKVYGEDLKIKGYSEVLILPDPTSCFKYYIFSAGSIGSTIPGSVGLDGTIGLMGWQGSSATNPSTMDFNNASAFYPFYSILDVSQPNISNPAIQGNLVYQISPNYDENHFPDHCKYLGDVNRNAFPLSNYMYTVGVTANRQLGVHYAASDLIVDVNGNYRWVFISDGYKVFKLKFTGGATPFTFVSSFSLPSSINTSNNYVYEVRAEMELIKKSNGNYMIAVPYSRSSSYAVYIAELNSSADITSPISSYTKTYNYSFSDNPIIHGLEFSSDGANLYVAHEKTTAFPNPLEKIVYATQVTSAVATGCGTCVDDFQKSQIEITTGNELVFATNNRLASLNTGSGTFNNSLQTITYPETNTFHCFSANNVSFTYLLPDQVDGMNYSTFQNQSSECCYFYNAFTIKEPITLPTGTYTVTNTSLVNCTNTTTGAAVPITFATISTTNSNITIPNGAKVTFQGLTIKFKSNTGMIVNAIASGQGGKVVLNATTLTWYTECGESQLWNGVTLNGGTSAQGTTSSSPHAVLTNVGVSQIDHALVALNIKGGAIVQLTSGSKLLDNKIAIEAEAYTSPTNPTNDVGFLNGITIKTQSTFNSVPTGQMSYLVRVTNRKPTFRFTNVTIIDDNSTYKQLYDGVISDNSAVTFSSGTTISNFRWGIYHTNSATGNLRRLNINACTFNSNLMSVYVGLCNYATITTSTFNVVDNTTLIQWPYGLFLDQSSKFYVTNNTFKCVNYPPVISGSGGAGDAGGIWVRNSNLHEANINIIKSNTFTKLDNGVVNMDKNYSYVVGSPNNQVGLRYYCNTFTTPITWQDFLINSGTIDYNQGVGDTTARNSFSHDGFFGDMVVNLSAIPSYTVLPSQYVHYIYKGIGTAYDPIINSPSDTYIFDFNLTATDKNTCGAGGGGEGQRLADGTLEPSDYLENINWLKTSISEITGQNNKNDGQDTLSEEEKQELSLWMERLQSNQNALIIHYLNDSITIGAMDSAAKYVQLFANDEKELFGYYIETSQLKKAASSLDLIREYEPANSKYTEVCEIMYQLADKDLENEMLSNPLLEQQLIQLANDDSDQRSYLIARNILNKINHIYGPYPVNFTAHTSTERRAMEEAKAIKNETYLSNYPNPFTGKTTLTAFVPKGSTSASIVITDVLGKVVAKFDLTEGNNSVEFDKQEVKGILYYSLFVDGQRKETKMMMKQ